MRPASGRGPGIHGVRGASGDVWVRGPGFPPRSPPPRAALPPGFHPPETLHTATPFTTSREADREPSTPGRQSGTGADGRGGGPGAGPTRWRSRVNRSRPRLLPRGRRRPASKALPSLDNFCQKRTWGQTLRKVPAVFVGEGFKGGVGARPTTLLLPLRTRGTAPRPIRPPPRPPAPPWVPALLLSQTLRQVPEVFVRWGKGGF